MFSVSSSSGQSNGRVFFNSDCNLEGGMIAPELGDYVKDPNPYSLQVNLLLVNGSKPCLNFQKAMWSHPLVSDQAP